MLLDAFKTQWTRQGPGGNPSLIGRLLAAAALLSRGVPPCVKLSYLAWLSGLTMACIQKKESPKSQAMPNSTHVGVFARSSIHVLIKQNRKHRTWRIVYTCVNFGARRLDFPAKLWNLPVDTDDTKGHDGGSAAHYIHPNKYIAEHLSKKPLASRQVCHYHERHYNYRHGQVGHR